MEQMKIGIERLEMARNRREYHGKLTMEKVREDTVYDSMAVQGLQICIYIGFQLHRQCPAIYK